MYGNSCTDPGCLASTHVTMLYYHGDVRCVLSVMLRSSLIIYKSSDL